METSIHPHLRLSYIKTTVECEIFQLSGSLMTDYTGCMCWKVESLKYKIERMWVFLNLMLAKEGVKEEQHVVCRRKGRLTE